MDYATLAVILVGYQNDYFSPEGILRPVVEDPGRVDQVLNNTLALIEFLLPTQASLFATGIVLTPQYRALANSTGILDKIKMVGAFKAGTPGAAFIPEFSSFGDRIQYVKGKEGFNSFQNTDLSVMLANQRVQEVWVAGMVTSLCVDSTARAAYELGYKVSILKDCCSARTSFEQDYFCENVFPLYGRVIDNAAIMTNQI